MALLIKKLSDFSLAWQLLLVPIAATLSFAAYLVYSSIVLSNGENVLVELRDVDYPILDEAEKNLNAYGRVVDALEAAVATGEVDFLDIAKEKANEITKRYDVLEKLDHRSSGRDRKTEIPVQHLLHDGPEHSPTDGDTNGYAKLARS